MLSKFFCIILSAVLMSSCDPLEYEQAFISEELEMPEWDASMEQSFAVSGGGTVGYFSSHALTQPAPNITRAIIVIHGTHRNAYEYFETIREATGRKNSTADTLIVAPRFDIVGTGAELDKVVWTNGGWKRGDLSTEYLNRERSSSFSVLDELVQSLASHGSFLNLEEITLVGHSAGGQFIHRYALASTMPNQLIDYRFRFISANPSSYLYLNAFRPSPNGFEVPVTHCAYNDFKYGLLDRNTYFSRLGTDELVVNYLSRDVVYLLGGEDTLVDSHLDTSCEAQLQGSNRLRRGQNYYDFLNTFYDGVHQHQLYIVPDAGHSRSAMFLSEIALDLLFPMTATQ